MLHEARVFDVYRGGQMPDGKKSVAIRVSFQSPERTLSDKEGAVLPRAGSSFRVSERFDAELRVTGKTDHLPVA